MKIKQLHIRNIASIERGDIDFENGLQNPYTDEQAPLFLITGDTGAGKTVILDCIALCLFGTTPRIEGVRNVRNNSYLIAADEEMNINSVQQYTRNGIKPGDECYAELLFEGNDGREYTARLELGMMKRRGQEGYKHRNRNWNWRRGDEGPVTAVKDIEDMRSEAVGMSFEQFCRISMLAQGEFATFLTGEKEKREIILEQLTNTSRFTLYGQAIENIYKCHNREKEDIKLQFATLKAHAMSEEEKTGKCEQMKTLEEERRHLAGEREELERRLTCVSKLREATAAISTYRLTLENIKKREESEEISSLKLLLKRWESSEPQRRLLLDKQKSAGQRDLMLKDLERLCEKYAELCSDKAGRGRVIKLLKTELEEQQRRLREQEPNAPLYAEAAGIITSLRAFLQTGKDIERETLGIKNSEEKIAELGNRLSEAIEAEKKARKESEAAATQLEEIGRELEKTGPEAAGERLTALNSERQSLTTLGKEISDWHKLKEENARRNEEIKLESIAIAKLKQEATQAEERLERAKAEHKDAERTMNMMAESLDDYLRSLRVRLHEDHADICPLCGQAIGELPHDEDFEQLLMPLRERRNTAANAEKGAESEYKRIINEHSKATGLLESKQQLSNKISADIATREKNISETCEELSIRFDADPEENIRERQQRLAEEYAILEERRKEGHRLMAEINRLTREKRPLDLALEKSTKTLADVRKDIEKNEQLIADMTQRRHEQQKRHAKMEREIGEKLDSYMPAWREQTEAAGDTLHKDAEAYSSLMEATNRQARKLELLEREMDNIDALQQPLHELYGNIPKDMEIFQPKERNPVKAWTELSAADNLARKTLSQAEENIEECDKQLSPYYSESGEDEHSLSLLMKREGEIETARKICCQLHDELLRTEEALNVAEKQRDHQLAVLGVEKEEDVPASDTLEERKRELALLISERDGAIGSIREQLAGEERNHAAYVAMEKRKKEAEAMAGKWEKIHRRFGGNRFRTLVQAHILRPLLQSANLYLEKITDQYHLTCSDENEQLSILVLDRYSKDQVRSVTVLSGGERFMISLALSLALSTLNNAGLNVDILFIDEGFGTLDEKSLDSVMGTLERLREIAGQQSRRVGIISHREELAERIPVQIRVAKEGQGRSRIYHGSFI